MERTCKPKLALRVNWERLEEASVLEVFFKKFGELMEKDFWLATRRFWKQFNNSGMENTDWLKPC